MFPKKNDDLFKETGEYQIFEWGICIPYSTKDIRQKLYELKAQYEQNASSWRCPYVAYEDITNIAVY